MQKNFKQHFIAMLHLTLFHWQQSCQDENEVNEFFIEATEAFFMALIRHLGACTNECTPDLTLYALANGLHSAEQMHQKYAEHMHPRFLELLEEALSQVDLNKMEPENEKCS